MPYNLLFDVATTYFYSFYETARIINNSGHLAIIKQMHYYTTIIWVVSRLYYMYLTCKFQWQLSDLLLSEYHSALVLDVILSRTSAVQKYFELVSELKDYMGHKKLPCYLQKRLLRYYEFRYEKTYFRENEILSTISGQLKQVGIHE